MAQGLHQRRAPKDELKRKESKMSLFRLPVLMPLSPNCRRVWLATTPGLVSDEF